MKKSLLALAALSAVAGVAQAQSSVTLYGTIDMGYSYQTNTNANGDAVFGANTATNNGGSGAGSPDTGGYRQSNRFGIKGTEDIGGGLKANFVLESGLNTMNGQANGLSDSQNGQLFNRASWAGLQGSNWEVRLGRDYHSNFKTIALYDPMEYYYTGVAPSAALLSSRFNNMTSVELKSGAWTFGAEFAPHSGSSTTVLNNQDTNTTSAGDAYAARLSFSNAVAGGKLDAGAAYTVLQGDPNAICSSTSSYVVTNGTWGSTPCAVATYSLTAAPATPISVSNTTQSTRTVAWTAGAAYTIGAWKLTAGYYDQKADITLAETALTMVGVKYSASPKVDIRTAYYGTSTTYGQNAVPSGGRQPGANTTVNQYMIAVDYKLSPRTVLYVEADQYSVGGGLSAAAAALPSTNNRVGFGIGHTF